MNFFSYNHLDPREASDTVASTVEHFNYGELEYQIYIGDEGLP